MKKKKSAWFSKVNPWACEFILLCCAAFGLVFLIGSIRDVTWKPVPYNQLQRVEGKMKSFRPSIRYSYTGAQFSHYEITLENGRDYYITRYIVEDLAPERFYPLRSDRYVGASVTLWTDRSSVTQIYAIEVDGEEYLSYEETCDYLSALYMSWVPGDLKIAVVLFVLTGMIGTLLFLLADKSWEADRLAMMLNKKEFFSTIYRYYPTVSDEYRLSKAENRKATIANVKQGRKGILKKIQKTAGEYKVFDWTDEEACGREFRVLLHKNIEITDDDKIQIKSLDGVRRDLRIFISALGLYYYMFAEETRYSESEGKWVFKKIEDKTGVSPKIDEMLSKMDYIRLNDEDAHTIVPNIETEHKEFGTASVFNCLFTDLEDLDKN